MASSSAGKRRRMRPRLTAPDWVGNTVSRAKQLGIAAGQNAGQACCKRETGGMPPAGTGLLPLEPDLRSEGDLHVVVGAMIEVDLVTDFSPKTDGAGECFDASARIHGKIRSAGVKPD